MRMVAIWGYALLNSLVLGVAQAAEAARASGPLPIATPSAGDNIGEEQPPPSGYPIPAAPVLDPAEAVRTFKLPPGYHIELVASEPLVQTPVALEFDPDGRIWVVEMRGYQNNPEGSNRLEPIGRIVVLEDTDGDGKMDRSTVYMDKLVLPRAVKVLSDGVLVGAPPNIWFTRDTNGDLQADERVEITHDFGVMESNPANAPGGLVWGMDNWLHATTYSSRLRRVHGQWVKDPVPVLGHWGIGMDDYGRTYMSPNSAPFRVNLISSHYQMRNPNHDGSGGVYEPMNGKEDSEVYPIRPTPGVNRGYMKGILRKDGTLARYTAGCGTSIFRGDRLPAEMYGNHFFCEPAANLVRRSILSEHADGTITAANAYSGAEFLASSDERFRPVATYTAPDGTLYIADIYRGVLESHPFVTTYLKRQIYERGLLQPLDRGRIYRVVHESMKPGPPPRLNRATSDQLVGVLAHPNGWWRDTAQRLLVERADASVVPALRTLAYGGGPDVPRLHAFWTLEGLDALTPDDILRALQDSGPHIRAAALRWAEPALKSNGNKAVVAAARGAIDDPAALVRLQAAASLGELPGNDAVAALAELLSRHRTQPFIADAVIHSVPNREFDLLSRLAPGPAWTAETKESAALFSALAAAIFRSGVSKRAQQLLDWAAGAHPSWQTLAILKSVTKPTRLQEKIVMPKKLAAAEDERIRLAATSLVRQLEPEDPRARRALTNAEQGLFQAGEKSYAVYCAQCHQANGRGLPGMAPALAGSKWVLGSPGILTQLVLHGKQGSSGTVMPPWGNALDDRHLASILTYVRRAWGNQVSPVSLDTVRRARSESKTVNTLWTEESLTNLAAAGKN
jgi:mono/diheme cytochrome c family protein/glucose/arabinose dehydrogenase